jgi:hypothetical protein
MYMGSTAKKKKRTPKPNPLAQTSGEGDPLIFATSYESRPAMNGEAKTRNGTLPMLKREGKPSGGIALILRASLASPRITTPFLAWIIPQGSRNPRRRDLF